MKLISLSIKNFKGIESLTLEPNGKDISIYGDNETGKTTISDAYSWLLFGKDSLGQTEFEIKPLDENNKVIPGLSPEVSAVIETNGTTIELCKIYEEKWTQKRGDTKKTFSGHQTKHYINQAPASKSEYEKEIANIITDIRIFRLLSDPRYFNVHLNWQERRNLLVEICGDISDDEVINSNNELAELPLLIGSRSISKHQEMLKDKRKSLKQEIESIPDRIDELVRGLYNHPDDPEKIKNEIAQLEKTLYEKQNQDSKKKILEIESELLQIKNQFQEKQQKEITDKKTEQNIIKQELADLQLTIQTKEKTLKNYKAELEDINSQLKTLRKQWHETNQLAPPEDTCPTCGQTLPEKIKKKALADFNAEKSEKLQTINDQGKNLKSREENILIENKTIEKELEERYRKIEQLETALAKKEKEILLLAQQKIDNDPEYQKKLQELESIETEEPTEIKEIEEEINNRKTLLFELEQDNKNRARIEELKKQEKNLSKELEQIEYELNLIDIFYQTQTKMLESKINSSFQYAQFKLFQRQVNGDIIPTCETLYKGVPYNSMNNAAKINIGLDIINTFSKFYGFAPPIFIDNCESVTKLIDTEAQIIKLLVSEQDKTLRIEQKEPAIAVGEPDF